ncbi:single-stranded DNA-binding protein [Pontibacter sp. G13]|uniref:single-stranded DNA-binding protein n=1 Tax=Pontibacter sp. G13 TaxID=3074898 RepID=UPI0028893E9B|nr:single-stranded DNA-binding protein [Pontibacter sp. G13]WNJ20819.1 single-stranded DNA-binding protein [Pontibacter sp. G13]
MAKYGLNKVTLIGNLGADPEIKYLDQGIPFANIRIACTESFRDRNGGNRDHTEWVNVTVWRGQAEVVGKFCRKGSTVCVEGRLRTRSWQTPEGETRYRTEVEATRVILLDGRPQQQPFNQPVAQSQPTQQMGYPQQQPNTQVPPTQPPAHTGYQQQPPATNHPSQPNTQIPNQHLAKEEDLPF